MKNHHFLCRLGFAVNGLKSAWQHEKSIRTQVVFAIAALLLMLVIQPALIWWALVVIMIALVIAAELINTALEHLADHLHPEQHPKIRLVKDCAAAAVLLLSIAAISLVVLMLIDSR